ncbi:unnamed protein product, partial [Iphiclides podalirius]
MVVPVEKAKEYMKHNNDKFESIGYNNSDKSGNDFCNNKLIYADYTRTLPNNALEYSDILSQDYVAGFPQKFLRLVQDIEAKQMLFAETEYMLRKIPIEQTVNFDLKLIVQNIMHVSSSMRLKFYKSNVIVMRETSPLATLGFVAQLLCAHSDVVIESSAQTAVLCHIFTVACHNAGLNNVKLALVENSPSGGNDVTEIPELLSGCVAVVTGSADVDSAVDALIAAPDKGPWRLGRVSVQECIGERFRRALSWKSALEGSNPQLGAARTAYAANGKLFSYEHHGRGVNDLVAVDEYRTVRELLSLSNACAPLALSLWCGGVAEANEIAHNSSADLVWINGYGAFAGPPAASQGFYSILDVAFAGIGVPATAVQTLSKSGAWMKLTADKRRELLYAAWEQFGIASVSLDTEFGADSFASVEGPFLCIGIRRPAGLVACLGRDSSREALAASLAGNAVLFGDAAWQKPIHEAMAAAGAPVATFRPLEGDRSVPSALSSCRTKVVWTSFGTVFAN